MKTTRPPLLCSAAMALALTASAVHAETIRFWTTEEQPERLARQETMAEAFAKATAPTSR